MDKDEIQGEEPALRRKALSAVLWKETDLYWTMENGREFGDELLDRILAAVDETATLREKNSGAVGDSFQERVGEWMQQCFTPEIIGDKLERSDRFIEESLELVQACGYSAERAHALVEYVFGRPVGERAQEVGGVMVTLAALCNPHGLDMEWAGETELLRILAPEVIEKIRAKRAAKPVGSALPVPTPDADLAGLVERLLTEARDWIEVNADDGVYGARNFVGEIDDLLTRLASRHRVPDDGLAEEELADVLWQASGAIDPWNEVLPGWKDHYLKLARAVIATFECKAIAAALASPAPDGELVKMREALEACELAFVTAGTSEVGGVPCRLIAVSMVEETLQSVWAAIPSHVERDPAMRAMGAALATPVGENRHE